MRGTMLWFNEAEDYGFISTEEDERLYVHGSGFGTGEKPVGRCAGMIVEFEVGEEDGRRQAEGVHFPVDAAPRRARLRHGGGRGART